jgi:hypothetical protein
LKPTILVPLKLYLTDYIYSIFFVTKTEYSYEKTFNRSNTFIFN